MSMAVSIHNGGPGSGPQPASGPNPSDAKKYPHMAHLLNGQQVHSSGHSKASATKLASDLRSNGVFASVIKDPQGARGASHLVTVPRTGVHNMLNEVETLVCNITGDVRRETVDGKEWLVAPVTMIQPGVLPGNRGPGLYTIEEMVKCNNAWNGMPICTPTHPHDGNGNDVSARNPHVIEKFGVGNVYNTNTNGKTTAEAWFDIEKANRVDPRLVPSVERGDKLELSTGLGLKRVPSVGVHNETGKQYEWIGKDYEPDHLAILLDSKGACSVFDGCGVNNEAIANATPNQASSASDKACAMSDSMGSHPAGYHSGNAAKANQAGNHMDAAQGHSGAASSHRDEAYSKRGTAAEPKHIEAAVAHEHAAALHKSLVNNTVDKRTIWNKLSELLGMAPKPGKPEQTDTELADAPLDTLTTEGVSAMKLNPEQRTAIVNDLITNCDCSGFKEEARPTLNKMDDEALSSLDKMNKAAIANAKKIKQQELVVNAAQTGLKVGEVTYVVNAEGKYEAKQPEKKEPVANSTQEVKLEQLPVAVQNQLKRLEAMDNQRKTHIVNTMTADVKDAAAKASKVAVYNAMELDALEILFAGHDEQQAAPAGPSYFGAGAGLRVAPVTNEQLPVPLGLPTIDWSKAG